MIIILLQSKAFKIRITDSFIRYFYWSKLSYLRNKLKTELIDSDIVDDAVLWCTWGAVVGREPEFEVTSEILWVMSSRIRSSQNGIRDDITQRISDVTSNSGSRPTTAPQVHHRTASSTIYSAKFITKKSNTFLWMKYHIS